MLRHRGVEAVLLDRSSGIGDSWRGHYDRLHLHTVRWLSDLPGLPIPRTEGKWVSRDGVVRYLDAYARHHRLDVRLRTDVRRIDRADGGWTVVTGSGPMIADHVVVATGYNRVPWIPPWPAMDSFAGDVVHASAYRNPKPYAGRDVLVVGTGNSGAEIAVDLVEGGAGHVSLAVRTPPNIVRRDLAGFPTQVLGVALRRLPPRLVDPIAAATRRLTVGDLRPYGMPPPPRGLYTRARDDDIIPILDVGLIDMLKAGRIDVVPAVDRFDGPDVVLAGGRRMRVDAVIAATGYRRGLEDLVGHLSVLGPKGRPVVHGDRTHPDAPNLYFIGYTNPISGNLRELSIDARRIARAIAAWRRSLRASPAPA
ncbi:MAG TPA: NAD(P)/FAD-dependent oxidoreductase [Actinomycetota bacterium]|nr:NAD(P)/FAD-dependent oxidoreductase [Actinomycetota bacterium]